MELFLLVVGKDGSYLSLLQLQSSSGVLRAKLHQRLKPPSHTTVCRFWTKLRQARSLDIQRAQFAFKELMIH